MKKYMIKETVDHFHEIEIDDELELHLGEIIQLANEIKHGFNTGYETLDCILQKYKNEYGFIFRIKPNSCGTDVLNMEVVDELY